MFYPTQNTGETMCLMCGVIWCVHSAVVAGAVHTVHNQRPPGVPQRPGRHGDECSHDAAAGCQGEIQNLSVMSYICYHSDSCL